MAESPGTSTGHCRYTCATQSAARSPRTGSAPWTGWIISTGSATTWFAPTSATRSSASPTTTAEWCRRQRRSDCGSSFRNHPTYRSPRRRRHPNSQQRGQLPRLPGRPDPPSRQWCRQDRPTLSRSPSRPHGQPLSCSHRPAPPVEVVAFGGVDQLGLLYDVLQAVGQPGGGGSGGAHRPASVSYPDR